MKKKKSVWQHAWEFLLFLPSLPIYLIVVFVHAIATKNQTSYTYRRLLLKYDKEEARKQMKAIMATRLVPYVKTCEHIGIILWLIFIAWRVVF